MSKTASTELKNHLAGEVTTVALCWKITRKDGQIFGFTNHDEDIAYDGQDYKAATGFTASELKSKSDSSVDNLDVRSFFNSDYIARRELEGGKFDFAELHLFLINYKDKSQGILKLRRGWLGEVTSTDTGFTVEVRGLSQVLQQPLGLVYEAECGADLGDARCKVNLAGYTVTGTITSVDDRRNFYDSSRSEEDDYFKYGEITFTSGNNNGFSMEVKGFTNSNGKIELFLSMPDEVEAGDTYSMYAGCDKLFDTCKEKFDNVINFRGFPHIPGADEALQFGGNP